jgi:hypothetical protein
LNVNANVTSKPSRTEEDVHVKTCIKSFYMFEQKEQLLEDNKKFNYGDRVNISEEVNKTGMWLQVRRSSTKGDDSIYQ